MESAFESINQTKSTNDISKCIEESLKSKFGFRNCIDFANAVLKNQKRCICEQLLYYNMNKYNQKGSFDILNDTRKHVTLVKLMDTIGNMNNYISVVGYWIFDSNYEK